MFILKGEGGGGKGELVQPRAQVSGPFTLTTAEVNSKSRYTASMHYLMTALGSYGDVLPLVGLAQAMQGRGHQATVISNPHFQEIIESAGVGYLPLGTLEEYHELAHHPDLWDPVRGPIFVMRTTVSKYLRPLYQLIDETVVPGETVLVAHCLDFASRVHQDAHGTPVASVHLAPVALRSFHESPQMFKMLMQDWWPAWFRKSQFWLADRLLDRILAPELDPLRRDVGLKPVRNLMHSWYFSPQLVLALFPDWFARPQPDWPANVQTTGFPLWDQARDESLPEEVEEFLADGSPPIVFAPGSAMTSGEEIFAAAVDASVRLKRRAILCTKYPEQLPAELPAGIRSFGFVSFSQLLPRASALVHHGGIGTSAQGLAAGLPQLVMPMAYDQLDNATRLMRLGVAEMLPRKKFRGPRVAELLSGLLADEAVAAAAQECASRINASDSLQMACEALEGLAATSGKT